MQLTVVDVYLGRGTGQKRLENRFVQFLDVIIPETDEGAIEIAWNTTIERHNIMTLISPD